MNGMRIPVASAGSNHAGGKETGTPQVTWPAGASARTGKTATKISTTRASAMGPSDLFMTPPVRSDRSDTCQVPVAGATCQSDRSLHCRFRAFPFDLVLRKGFNGKESTHAYEYRPASPSAAHHAGKDLPSVPRSGRDGQ